jgi:hypothetical protein
MNFTKFNKPSSVSLKERSKQALSSFYEVLEDLKEINQEAELKRIKLKEDQDLIEREIIEIDLISLSNLKVIGNIENILS